MKREMQKSDFENLSKFDKMTLGALSSVQGGVGADTLTSGEFSQTKNDDSDHGSASTANCS
ncbi:hypothetical protein ACUN24_20880 [Pedobacter sp. WC2501]|uniref:hypothetical protein n=1 Tax=Pedobacter sp. WC2501 TaxID=3461400 RepID=UPI004045C98A